MSFKSPWLLLALVVLAIAIGLWILADRRRARYTVRYTNVDVLATVVSGRSWLRYVPSGARRARPGRAPRRTRAAGGDAIAAEGTRDGDPRCRHVPLDAGTRCRADASRRRARGAADISRPGAGRPPGRTDRLRR